MMNDKINLKNMERTANRLLTQDGLIEMLLGFVLFASSASFSSTTSVVPFLPLYVIYLKHIVEGFRNRYTYPRIGYVRMPDESVVDAGTGALKYMGIALVVLVIGLLLGFGRPHVDLLYKWATIGIGLLFSGAMYYLYEKSGDWYYFAYILVFVAEGVVFVFFLPFEGRDVIQFYLLSMAVIFAVVGVARFVTFTRNNPILEAPEDE
jgi:hypothetical protein